MSGKALFQIFMAKSMTKPGWLRILRIIFGLIAIAASFFVLASPGVAIYILVLLLSFAMLSLGVVRLARGFSHSLFSKEHRIVDVIVGVLGIILGFVVLAFPLLGAGTLVFLLAFATMVYGFGSIVIGAWVSRLAKWMRALLVIFGLIAVVFSFIVIANPAIGVLTLVYYLAISFLVHGVESIVSAF